MIGELLVNIVGICYIFFKKNLNMDILLLLLIEKEN